MKNSLPSFDILIESAIWKGQRGLQARLKKAARATLDHLPKSRQALAAKATWTLLLTTDHAVHKLNKDYRGFDKTTNVLSFPQFAPETLDRILKKNVFCDDCGHINMGDIAVSSRYVVQEARREGKLLQDHLTHLMIHGILHLFGYDHIEEGQAEKMEKLEKQIMKSLGLPDPYAPDSCGVTQTTRKKKNV